MIAMNSKRNWLDYDTEEMISGDKETLWHHLKPHRLFDLQEQMIIVEGKGLILTDIRGKEYLDATSGGVWSVMVGYGRDSIADAVCAQMKKMPYFAGVYGNIPAIQFARKLLAKLPNHQKVYFSNSGSEANEKAFKMVRQAARISPERNGKTKILYRDRDYHGTTFGAMSATGQALRKQDFGPLLDGFVEFPHCCCFRCPFGKTTDSCSLDCATKVDEIILAEGPDTVGGLIVEPVTAGGGILTPPPGYFPRLQEICRKYKVWMIMDEVVCGFGRTGKFWGHEHFDVDPEIITMAKGLASSYEALSAVAVKQEIYDLFLCDPSDPKTRINYFRDISTYGGCASAYTAALESTRIIEDERLVENSAVMGAYLLDRLTNLRKYDVVGDVRGKGLFAGIEFVADPAAKTPVSEEEMARLMGAVFSRGVIVGRTNASFHGFNNIMNFAPSLIITREQVDRIVDTVEAAIKEVFC